MVAGDHLTPDDPAFAGGLAPAWLEWRARVDLDEYERRWDRQAAGGAAVHGEADAVARLGGRSVLDAGCGMGRVGIELARRGRQVVGVDADRDLLDRARRRAPELDWRHGDLSVVDLDRRFDVVVLAGNVMLFAARDVRRAIVSNMAKHLEPDGCLVAGFTLSDELTVAAWDRWAADAGLVADGRWATWDGEPYSGGDYLVAVDRPAG